MVALTTIGLICASLAIKDAADPSLQSKRLLAAPLDPSMVLTNSPRTQNVQQYCPAPRWQLILEEDKTANAQYTSFLKEKFDIDP